MNILLRAKVVAGVLVATATVGAVSGVVVASALLTTQLRHFHSSTLWEVIKLGSQAGATFGILLGAPTTFALLRRIPFTRIAFDTFVAATYGGIAGFAFSLPFAQPRPSVGFMVAGSCIGFAVAATRLWARSRDERRAAAIPSVG